MAIKTITLQCESGEYQTQATVFGRFAVHHVASMDKDTNEFFFNKEWYSVSHIKSGRSVMRFIETKKAASDFARRMNTEFHDSLIESCIAGEKPALDRFMHLIRRWHNDHEVNYSY